MWCGVRHIYKECPETNKRENSIPNCCNCKLKDGERPHSSNYRCWSHAREELQNRSLQRSSNEGLTARNFPDYVVPGKSFAAALRSKPQQQQQPPVIMIETPSPIENQQYNAGHSVSLDNMFRAPTVVQQIMKAFNGAVPEEAQIVAIITIVLYLIENNGH
jgi:hypothetical protein